MSMIRFGMIGAGWRSLFFMRIVKAVPERFACVGVVVRDAEKRRAFHAAWQVPVYASLAELLDAQKMDFVVVSTTANDQVIRDVVKQGIPCLSETPPARALDALIALYEDVQGMGGRVQIAEQYHLRPHHQAHAAVLESGRIGNVSQVQASIAHGYHGLSMIRRLLGVTFENAEIQATRFSSPLVRGPDRAGPPQTEEMIDSDQVLAWMKFAGGKLGVLDFTTNQYRAWIRDERLLIRGERGEIANRRVTYLKTFDAPMAFDLERVTHGQEADLKPPLFVGYRGEGEWLYRNPFPGPILMDDEIAMAHCLVKMQAYVRTGRDFYSLAEASQDTYLGILYEDASRDGRVVESETQIWAKGE